MVVISRMARTLQLVPWWLQPRFPSGHVLRRHLQGHLKQLMPYRRTSVCILDEDGKAKPGIKLSGHLSLERRQDTGLSEECLDTFQKPLSHESSDTPFLSNSEILK